MILGGFGPGAKAHGDTFAQTAPSSLASHQPDQENAEDGGADPDDPHALDRRLRRRLHGGLGQVRKCRRTHALNDEDETKGRYEVSH